MVTNNASNTATGISGTLLQGAGVGSAPTFSTSTYPTTNAVSTLLYASSANVMGALATANSAILATNSSGVPSITTASGNWLNTSRSCFLAQCTTNKSNVTGDGTAYTVIFETVNFDQASNYNNTTGTFTAPVTGKYLFQTFVDFFGATVADTSITVDIVTNGGTYRVAQSQAIGAATYGYNGSVICPMTATNTATVVLTVGGSTKTVSVTGSLITYFSGMLVC